MKIHVIRIQNINSLSCSGDEAHVVDLDRDLGHAPIFLIHGPTGAGKSTILDAITLALFGRTARLDDATAKAVKKDEDIGETDARRVLSHGAVRGYAEVDFSTKVLGARLFYRARWTASRAYGRADGTMKAPTRTLWRIEAAGAPADDAVPLLDSNKKTDILAAFGSVLNHMAFEDFVRSVLLAQGDFQAFLKADRKDRSAMLARLTDATAFRSLGLEAGRRFSDSKTILGRIEARVDATTFLDAAELAALRGQLAALDEAAKGLASEEQGLTARLRWADELLVAADADAGAEVSLQAAREALDSLAETRKRVARAEQAAKLMLPIGYAATRAQEVAGAAVQVERLAGALPQIIAGHTASAAKATETRDSLSALQVEFDRMRPLIAHALRATEASQRAATAAEQLDAVSRGRDSASFDATRAAAAAREAHVAAIDAVMQAKATIGLMPVRGTQEALVQRVREGWSELKGVEQRRNAARARLRSVDLTYATTRAQVEGLTASLGAAQVRATEVAEQLRVVTGALTVLTGEEAPEAARRRMEAARSASVEAVSRCQRAIGMLLQLVSVQERETAARGVVEQKTSEIAVEEASIGERDERLRVLSAELEELDINGRALERVLEIATQRDLLQPGKACPLCGSDEHPWAAGAAGSPAANSNRVLADENNQAIEKAKSSRRAAEAERADALKRLDAAKLEVAKSEGELKPLRDALGRLEAELSVELDALATPRGAGIDALEAQQHRYQAEEVAGALALERLLAAVESMRAAEALHERASHELARAQLLAEHAHARLHEAEKDRTHVTSEVAIDEAAVVAARQVLVEACRDAGEVVPDDTTLEEFTVIGTRLRAIVDEIDAAQIVLQGAEETAGQRLVLLSRADSEAKAAVVEAEKATASALAATAELRGLAGAKQEALAGLGGRDPQGLETEWRDKLEAAAAAFEAARVAEHDAAKSLGEARSGLTHHREHRDRAAAAAAEANARVVEALAAAEGWSDVAEVESATMPAESLKHASETIATAMTSLISAEATRVTTRSRLNAAMAAATDGGLFGDALPEPEELLAVVASAHAAAQSRYALVRQELAALHHRRGAVEADITADTKARNEHATLLAQLDEARADYAHWERIYQIIGTREGEAFVTLAQGYHLEALAERANARLRLLSRRYSLSVKTDEVGAPTLDFLILDEEQARNARPPSTLSGGETFVVSLALALALSDFRAMDQPIETVLIDEGFGTLDTETLSTVIATLESLHATSGSQIGLISHVAMLAERIPTRVYVKPVGQGRSELIVER